MRRFRGESVHKVDAKGRVSIPAAFRRVLEEGDPDWTEGRSPGFVIVHDRTGLPRLECFTLRAMQEIDEIVSTYPPFSEEREELEYFLNACSAEAQIDDAGRIVLNQKLRDKIGVTDEAAFAGMGESFHVWEPAAYAAHLETRSQRRAALGRTDVFALLDKSRLQRSGAA